MIPSSNINVATVAIAMVDSFISRYVVTRSIVLELAKQIQISIQMKVHNCFSSPM